MAIPKNHARVAASNGPRSRAGVIKLKPRSIHDHALVMRAEREIRAREAANHARLYHDGSEDSHRRIGQADRRAKDEVEINNRFRKAKVVGR